MAIGLGLLLPQHPARSEAAAARSNVQRPSPGGLAAALPLSPLLAMAATAPPKGSASRPATATGPANSGPTSSLERQASIPLECRLGGGPWQPCRMEVMELGSRWSLVVGSERVDFRHDGRGAVTMQRGGAGPWRGVSSRWEAPRQLCWDGVCARGEIPLD